MEVGVMADRTKIEWTDATWNPVVGCSVVSPGCTNCYAMRLAGTRLKHHPTRAGLTRPSKAGPVWNGQVRFNEAELVKPLSWRRPRMIFVCAHGDLFHEAVPDEWIDRVFAVMALCPQHTFQVLTKRPERMRAYMTSSAGRIADAAIALRRARGDNGPVVPLPHIRPGAQWWPLPNVWLGVSAEDQARADERIPLLLDTPAAVRFVSLEPLLGPIDLTALNAKFDVDDSDEDDWRFDALAGGHWFRDDLGHNVTGDGPDLATLDQVIVGGESGSDARPMHPAWVRSLRDQCAGAGTAFFFKQWGEWTCDDLIDAPSREEGWLSPDGTLLREMEHVMDSRCAKPCRPVWRVGKKAAGRLLDGVEHNGMPSRA
jgi:protein gp37